MSWNYCFKSTVIAFRKANQDTDAVGGSLDHGKIEKKQDYIKLGHVEDSVLSDEVS